VNTLTTEGGVKGHRTRVVAPGHLGSRPAMGRGGDAGALTAQCAALQGAGQTGPGRLKGSYNRDGRVSTNTTKHGVNLGARFAAVASREDGRASQSLARGRSALPPSARAAASVRRSRSVSPVRGLASLTMAAARAHDMRMQRDAQSRSLVPFSNGVGFQGITEMIASALATLMRAADGIVALAMAGSLAILVNAIRPYLADVPNRIRDQVVRLQSVVMVLRSAGSKVVATRKIVAATILLLGGTYGFLRARQQRVVSQHLEHGFEADGYDGGFHYEVD
jgi:hypothetical protein